MIFIKIEIQPFQPDNNMDCDVMQPRAMNVDSMTWQYTEKRTKLFYRTDHSKKIKGRGKCDNNRVSCEGRAENWTWRDDRYAKLKKNRFSLLFFQQTSSFHCLYMAIYLSVPHNYLSVLLLWRPCIYGRCLSVPDLRCIHVLRPTKCLRGLILPAVFSQSRQTYLTVVISCGAKWASFFFQVFIGSFPICCSPNPFSNVTDC